MRHAALAAVLALLGVGAAAHADVRAISDAERAAVQMAAEYLAGGAGALADDLAASSPIRRAGAAGMPLEIETRLGPSDGAEWRLVTVVDALKDKAAAFSISYPSGIDDTVFFEMTREGDAWKIVDLRITAIPSARKPLFPEMVKSDSGATATVKFDRLAQWAGVGAVVLAAVALLLMRKRGFAGRLVYLASIALVAGAAALAVMKGERYSLARPQTAPVEVAPNDLRLAPLIALRRALASGGHDVSAALAGTPRAGVAGDVVKLWKAQWDLNQMRVDDVRRALDSFSTPSSIPLVEILRARLALVDNEPTTAIVAYQNAINAGPGRDSLWSEMSLALMAGGFDELADKNLTRIIDIGSREPDVYYARASLSDTPEELDEALKKAWELQPVTRDRLVESGMLWSLVRKREGAFINLSDPHEPRVTSPNTSTRPIAMPQDAVARVSGDYLHVTIADAQLAVPGGAALAPKGALPVGADEWTRLEEERAIRDADSLLATPPTAASYMQPALRQRITSTSEALALRNRWNDVVKLTEEISPKSEFVPANLFFLRAEALQRIKRPVEAKRVLIELAASPALARRRDAYALEALGEMLSSFDEHRAAIRMIERARNIRPSPYQEVRITQIAMDEKLAKDYSTHKSEHFEIHYPQELRSGLAVRLAHVLESELKRLQSWIPVANFQPVVVNVVWWQDFRSIYTGSEDILGFYNGKITLPLAGIADFVPEIVAVVTHELAHAMIAQATNDQAPRWFHEGMAQRVSMVEYHANAFNMYEDDKLFAISVLDPVLRSSRDPAMMGAAYIVSQTLIRFIEERYGREGIQRLLAAYAAGEPPVTAVTTLAGRDLGEFNTAFRAWGKAEQRVFANRIAVRYDEPAPDTPNVPRLGTGKGKGETTRQRGQMGGGTFYPTPQPGSGAKP